MCARATYVGVGNVCEWCGSAARFAKKLQRASRWKQRHMRELAGGSSGTCVGHMISPSVCGQVESCDRAHVLHQMEPRPPVATVRTQRACACPLRSLLPLSGE